MSAARWQRIEELFHAAMDRDPKDRDAFLTEACGTDTELLHEVQSLLAETNKQRDFMERPAMEVEAESLSKQPAGALVGRFIAHYQMGPLVGTGGMAEVYRAHDTHLDRDVAIKVLLGSTCRDPETFGRFQREARLLASVTHPNIAAVYGFEQVDDQCALVMEMIEGETLSARIQREHLSIDEFLGFCNPDRRGDRSRPCERYRASRSQAVEHSHHHRWNGQSPRFWSGQNFSSPRSCG